MIGGILGIDFGTTNSLVAFMDGDRPALIPNARGSRTTPSAVALSAKGEILVGESARNQAYINPGSTVLAVKRLLGSGSPIRMGNRDLSPAEVAALILGVLRADAERHLGRTMDKAVITAPAHFPEPARRALLEAGRLVGLEILRVLNEPTAAALARAWLAAPASPGKGAAGGPADPRSGDLAPATLLVYDFGGGTFDVTVLRQEGRDCRVLASRGDGRLGGLDLDRALYEKAAKAFLEGWDLDVEADRMLAQQLADQAERTKIELSEREEATISLPFARRLADGGLLHPELTVSRAEFEALALPLVERSLELTSRALEDAGVAAAGIDLLLLSGGSSRIPLVRRLLSERFGKKPVGGVNPEEIVALGAAVEGALLSGSKRLRVRDVVSRSYGVEIEGGRLIPLIRKNSPVPVAKQRMFTTVGDDQDSVEIHVLQGESAVAAEDLSLGRFLLSGIKAARAGIPRISVDFSIDESDILHVSARDLESGIAQAITIVDLDRGTTDESAESLAGRTADLAGRLERLLAQTKVDGALGTEVHEAISRGKAARASEGSGRLRVLRAELEGLVGELLARGGKTGARGDDGAQAGAAEGRSKERKVRGARGS